MTTRERKLVVAGLIVDDVGRVLISERMAGQAHAGQWEFPGGKLEPGEAPVAGLARELQEELGVAIVAPRVWDVLSHPYPEFDLLMIVYACRLAPGAVARPIEVAQVAWCRPDQLRGFPILPADGPLVDRLIAEGPPRV